MKNRGNIATALILIALGLWFLAIEVYPPVKAFAYGSATWPIPIVGIGALLALVGLLTWLPGLFIPASIVGGIGGLLFWQNTTGAWETWAYAWALIPVFTGVGLFFFGLLTRRRKAMSGAIWSMLSGLVLFAIFGSFLGGFHMIFRFWPVLVIFFGVLLLVRSISRRAEEV